MASMAQTAKGGYTPVVIESGMRFADSLRFHAALDVRTMDHRSAYLMTALSWEGKMRKMKPKDKISIIAKLIGD